MHFNYNYLKRVRRYIIECDSILFCRESESVCLELMYVT